MMGAANCCDSASQKVVDTYRSWLQKKYIIERLLRENKVKLDLGELGGR